MTDKIPRNSNRGDASRLPKGRPKGAKNKFTRSAKEAFALAFEGIGGVSALVAWAQDNRTEFYRLYGRLIPLQHEGGVDLKIAWPLPKHPLEG